MDTNKLKKYIPHAAIILIVTPIILIAIYGLPSFSSANSDRPSNEECIQLASSFTTLENAEAVSNLIRTIKKDENITSKRLGIPEEYFKIMKDYIQKGCSPRTVSTSF